MTSEVPSGNVLLFSYKADRISWILISACGISSVLGVGGLLYGDTSVDVKGFMSMMILVLPSCLSGFDELRCSFGVALSCGATGGGTFGGFGTL